MKCVAIILMFILCSALADCQISSYMVEGTNRIFTYRDDRGTLQLYRTETVPNGLTLYMLCNGGDVVETQCQENGAFTVGFPMRCSNPMQPKAYKIQDNQCPEQMYIIGYEIERQQLELYRSCYDSKLGRVLYAQSDVYRKSFFPKRPFVDFTTDEIVTPAEASSYMKQNIYHAFCCVFGNGQNYLPHSNALIINRGHLVASADFLFVDQMTSTFRYLNIVPQFKSINDGNWEKIERWIRSQVPWTSLYRIKTGGIDVLTLPDENGVNREAYLSGSKLPVPLWTYKVVRDYNGNGVYVFLAFNCTFERQRPNVISICQIVPCPFSLPDNPHDGYIYCCDPSKFPY
ncbi:uncharacterized protein LOC117785368 isoform X2 [Drosophila innubila]|uniref:uncharacterized protein LOC117785368 isoform X2 n=1 Tax=Drosophila innubila TaxID=198719 RepID=UPI00148D9F9B|nr:uncharacterized protein LOC117785368 isoform X2 [Drosophila innubila]